MYGFIFSHRFRILKIHNLQAPKKSTASDVQAIHLAQNGNPQVDGQSGKWIFPSSLFHKHQRISMHIPFESHFFSSCPQVSPRFGSNSGRFSLNQSSWEAEAIAQRMDFSQVAILQTVPWSSGSQLSRGLENRMIYIYIYILYIYIYIYTYIYILYIYI